MLVLCFEFEKKNEISSIFVIDVIWTVLPSQHKWLKIKHGNWHKQAVRVFTLSANAIY